jgi:hypothetical protein
LVAEINYPSRIDGARIVAGSCTDWHQRSVETASEVLDFKNAANLKEKFGAPSETRTPDPLIKRV